MQVCKTLKLSVWLVSAAFMGLTEVLPFVCGGLLASKSCLDPATRQSACERYRENAEGAIMEL